MADPSTYTVGWICALTTELVAAKSFFDEEYEVTLEAQAPRDNNSYSFGRMGRHDVVVACLPRAEYGIAPAASVARDTLRTFPNIRVGLMVGIGGGAPSRQHDIRLGDVVQQEFQLTGSLNQPPQFLLTAVGALEADHEGEGHEMNERIEEALSRRPRLRKRYARPSADTDRLYESRHIHQESPTSAACKDNCGEEHLMTREARGDDEDDPVIHHGLIASSDKLMKDATIRDKLAMEEGVLCFEMEAAGLMNHFPCLIIRGVCDYTDSHKNKEWQGFAAMTAAAYAKELLQKILPTSIQQQKTLAEVLDGNNQRQKIERWLTPPRSSTNVAKAKKRRHDGTGQWFVESPAFTEFKTGSRKHLWLHGLAGCGKTVLSSQILDDLSAMDGIITLVHYFDFNNVEKQSLDGLLRSLAFQLYQHGGQDASAKLYEFFKSCRDGSGDPDASQLESCIKSMLSTIDRVFILIDALDECKSRDSLLSWIGRFTVENVQFLLTARPEGDIRPQIIHFFGEENCLSLDKTAVNGDIKSYVLSVLDTNPRFTEKALSEELRTDICNKVGGGADGMFRWAACQMDTLEACLTPNAVREALVSLPRDLPKTYDLIEGGVRWGGMRRWEKEVHLTHFSVKEYLTKHNAFYGLNTWITITETLINYLCDVKDPLYRVRADFPLAIRAEEIWHQTARRAQTAKKIVEMTAKLLFSTSNVLKLNRISQQPTLNWYSSLRWGRRMDGRPWLRGRAEEGFSFACVSGLKNTVAYMMEDPRFNVPVEEQEACLRRAILMKHPEVAEVLLDHGVSPDASDTNDIAVFLASRSGFTELVRKLIKAGADLSRETVDWDGYFTSALWQDVVSECRILFSMLLKEATPR
ncbi:hypothetical protein FPCIR_10972 [Fusarium pseudocircinatum]|uniref:Nephrocystin 3-like N-terminal domain-containing protein n=1 Tax=Fusarium pseudocircinatum TaxID=56676 RepID=A0A8H5NUF7_9HYPO|nr:hypothetical protein FPCIR_10972 [Fusarium pseudocircinatum]